MTKYRVVLVPFPFDDLSSSKVRPAVCLTDPIGPHRHLILAFITSRVPAHLLATDLVLDSRNPAENPPIGELSCEPDFFRARPPQITLRTESNQATVQADVTQSVFFGLAPSAPDFASTGLRASSTLRTHRLMTATTALVRRELGHLSPRMQAGVKNRLRKLFDLTYVAPGP